MPSGTTPNIDLSLGTIGGDNNTWGSTINANWNLIDALFTTTTLATGAAPRYNASGAITTAGVDFATVSTPGSPEVSITLDGSNNLDITTTTGGAAMEITQATSVVNFDKVPTVGGVSMPAGLGLGEIRTSIGSADVIYSNGEAWLICNGRTLSAGQQTTYAAYVAAFGAVLPNLAGRTPRGYNPAGGGGPTGTLGSDTVTLSQANLPAHTHTLAGSSLTSTDSGHGHSASSSISQRWGPPGGGDTAIVFSGPVDPLSNFNVSTTVNVSTANVSTVLNSLTLNNTGSGSAVTIIPASTIITYFVRVA